MEKKKNVFSKLLNRVKKVWQELGTPDIETGEGIKLTQRQREELAQIERIEGEVRKNNGLTVGQVIISEAEARKAAARKAAAAKANNNRKNPQIQKELGNA